MDHARAFIGPPASWRRAATAGLLAAAGWTVLALVLNGPLAARVASRDPLPLVGRPLPAFGPATPEELVGRTLTVLGLLVVLAAAAHARWPDGIRRFWNAPAAATDLAVLRIAVLALLLVLPRIPEAVRLSGFSPDVRVPPGGMPWLLDVVPASQATVRPLALVFLVACALALVGLWTRPALIVAAVLGLWLLGIPQFYGKVSHYHHVWWALALLAASPAGDALSVDSLRRAWRRPHLAPPRDLTGVRYGRPLRLLWLLLAMTYLFPGLWKYASAGWDWAFSDNLRFVLYEHWGRLDGYTSPLPIDRAPFTEIAGVFTIVFELAFLLILFSPRLRPWLAGVGLAFHNANFLFLRLGFFTLQTLYVSFVPWQRLADWIGSRRAGVRIEVAPRVRARRLVAVAAAADPLGRADVMAVIHTGDEVLRVHRAGQVATGADAVRRLVRRAPLLWPLMPVAWLLPRRRMDAWLAGTGRHAARAAAETATETVIPGRSRTLAVTTVGVALLTGTVWMGLLGVTAAWPVASYPTFAGIQAETIDRVSLQVEGADGTARLFTSAQLRDLVSWQKYDGLARPLLRGEPDPARVRGLLDVVIEEGGDVPSDPVRVTLFRDVERLTRTGPKVIDRTELATIDL
jgi:hypothetical protein